MRAQRLGLATDSLQLMAETDVDAILAAANEHKPKIMVVDSIQVVHSDALTSAPGSVAQVRDCAALLTRYAKRTGTVLILVGHVTKDGSLAGPKVLEHMIDCSVLLEGEQDSRYRTLRGQKNRFGAVNELGVFAMTDAGLKEVLNPSAIFLERADTPAPRVRWLWSSGRALAPCWLKFRPSSMRVTSVTHGALPWVLSRIDWPCCWPWLHRHVGLQVGDQDVFANVVGGVRIAETSGDLSLLLAVVSSLRDKILPKDLVVFGEVGLTGEIRPVASGQERIAEAAKHGFKRAIVPKGNAPRTSIPGITVQPVSRLDEAIALFD